MRIRQISLDFIKDLKDDNGELNWIYKKVKAPKSVYSLEIREGYINIYYRGGSLLKIVEKRKEDLRFYDFIFDTKYGKRRGNNSGEIVWCDFMLQHQNEVRKLTNEKAQKYFDEFREMMDGWFAEHSKKEREYQHYASLPYNNDNVLDIEYAIGESGMRLDMIMIDENGELYLIENKYGNYALSSATTGAELKPGLVKHYGDMISAVTKEDHWCNIKESMKSILKEKIELGLIPQKYRLKLDRNGKPVFHIMFVLADLTLSPKSTIIEREKQAIRKRYEKQLNEYPPQVLCVGKDQYNIVLQDAKDLLKFSL